MSRISFYKKYRNKSLSTKYKGVFFPAGSKSFWEEAAKSVKRKPKRIIKTIKQGEPRSFFYNKFVEDTKLTSFRGIKYPSGSRSFWEKAVRSITAKPTKPILKNNLSTIKKSRKRLLNGKGVQIGKFRNPNKDIQEKNFRELLTINEQMKRDGKLLLITSSNKKKFFHINRRMFDQKQITLADPFKSDQEVLKVIMEDVEGEIKAIDKKAHVKRDGHSGGFFKYLCKPEIYKKRWAKFGLFDKLDTKNYEINCVIRAFDESGDFSQYEITKMKEYVQDRYVSKKNFHLIADEFNCFIKIINIPTKGATAERKTYKSDYFGQSKSKRRINLVLYREHYFLNNKNTRMTKFAIENFDDVKDLEHYHQISNKLPTTQKSAELGETNYQRRKTYLSSYRLFQYLYENNFLVEFTPDQLMKTQYFDLVTDNDELNFNLSNFKKFPDTEYSYDYEHIQSTEERACMHVIGKIKKKIRMSEIYNTDSYFATNLPIEYYQFFIHMNRSELRKKNFNKKKYLKYKAIYKKKAKEAKQASDLVERKSRRTILLVSDFETYQEKNGQHTPYLINTTGYGITTRTIQANDHTNGLLNNADDLDDKEPIDFGTFYGAKCGEKLIKKIAKTYPERTVKLYFHNLSYDISFLLEHITIKSVIKNAGRVLSVKGSYKSTNFEVKCTLAMVNMKLADFNKSFNLGDVKKEIMPYDLYTRETVSNGRAKIADALNLLKKKDHKQFIENIELSGSSLIDEEEFDLINYSKWYCERDVQTTLAGFMKMRKWIAEMKLHKDHLTGQLKFIDIINYITLPSVANAFMTGQGVFEDCLQVNGNLREFMYKTIVGGKTMTRENNMFSITSDKRRHNLVDFDAVSQYPSAMHEFDGYLKGKCYKLKGKQLTHKFLKRQSGYFVEIKLKPNSIKKLPFPLLSRKEIPEQKLSERQIVNRIKKMLKKDLSKSEEECRKIILEDEQKLLNKPKTKRQLKAISETGIRNYSNDITHTFVDNYQLEDIINFHELDTKDLTIISGVYFKDGHNDKINGVIKYMFNERLKLKKQKNPAQLVYKLLMNSSYGKLITKPRPVKLSVKNSKEAALTHFLRNHNSARSMEEIGDTGKYTIKSKVQINSHCNAAHLGSNILSFAKRIINRVMFVDPTNKVKIYYMDTDSMHLSEKDMNITVDLFRKKYGRELVGKNLGQFHSDFAVEYKEGITPTNIRANKTIILGKKCYLDNLIYEDKDTNKQYTDNHIRMKGIPSGCVTKNDKSINSQYERLFKGKAITYDMSPYCLFEYSNLKVQNRTTGLTRRVVYNNSSSKKVKIHNGKITEIN